jgi:Ni,Fe-hydrogenase III small subunit
LITGTPQDMIIPIDVFVCGNCGGVNQELLPEQIRVLEKVEKENNGE